METPKPIRQDLLELAADYAEFCVLVTTAELDFPGPQVLYANSAFTRMTGYSVTDLLGKTPRILQGPDTDRRLLANLRRTLSEGNDFITRAVNYKRDGEPFELEWIISHLKDEQGNTTNYIAVQRDITGIERAKSELERYDEELREAQTQILANAERLARTEETLKQKQHFVALGEMAAGVMHDISNALTPVFGLVQLLHSIENLPPRARDLSSSMDSSIEHALEVLANLKNYYYNASETKHVPVELKELVQRLPDVTSAMWSEASHYPSGRYSFSIKAPSSIFVQGNEIELLQVLINLVLNAIEAMPDGGIITIGSRTEADRAVITIADTGPGMSPELAATCFDPYVSGRRSGTGLGLAVCKRIVESHNGDITVSTDQAQGVTFKISLPLLNPDEAYTRWRSKIDQVMIIGGNEAERELLVKTFSKLEITTVGTSGADTALAELYVTPYDCVVLNITLAPTTCTELAEIIRRSRPQTKVIWWVDESETGSQVGFVNSPDAVLHTPCSGEEIQRILNQLS